MAATKSRLSMKGLDKIFGDNINDVIRDIESDKSNTKVTTIKNTIPLSDIHPNPYQPRKYFDEDELKGLATSIKKNGLIQPIVVKKTINGYLLIAGERRVKASKLAGLTEIPAVIVDFNDEQMKEVALIENIQRVDLSPIEEAIAYKELSELLHLTQEQLAERIGKSRSHITNTMRLLNLPKPVQDLILNNTLTMGQVKPLISLDSDKKIIQLSKLIIAKQLNARQVEDMVKKLNSAEFESGPHKPATTLPPRNPSEYLEQQIMHKLGTKVIIENNRMIINYNGIKDLNRILEILGLLEKDL